MLPHINLDTLANFSHLKNIKSFNKRVILDMIRFTPGGISRAELARQMCLTRAAVTSIVADLERMGLVDETETGPTTGGRRPILLAMNPRFGYVVGIDLGANHLRLVVTDFAAHVLEETEYPFSVAEGPAHCLEQIDQQLNLFLKRLTAGAR